MLSCSCSPLKGVLFWRWDGVTAAVNSAEGDNALTLGTNSDVFQVLVLAKSVCMPFSTLSFDTLRNPADINSS